MHGHAGERMLSPRRTPGRRLGIPTRPAHARLGIPSRRIAGWGSPAGRGPGGWGSPAGRGPDHGAAVVEFVLVAVLLVALLLGVLQVGLVLHMRNVVVASVAEGAREAANADRSCSDGAARARDLVARSLSSRIADRLDFGCADAPDGLVAVRVRGTLPLLLLPVTAVGIDATGHAVEEAP